MIRIILGNVGGGKTALVIREMALNENNRLTYTNIKTELPTTKLINHKMIIKREIVDYKKNKKTGDQNPIYKSELNVDFWKNIKEPINVVLDEAHSIMNSRRSMSKINVILTDWLALIRRILGEQEGSYGTLTFITQLPNRIDIIAREMATNVTYCVMHYKRTCTNCNSSWQEHSELPETTNKCYVCHSTKLKRSNFTVEVWEFTNMNKFLMWSHSKTKSFFKHYYVKDIQKYFNYYDTLQWENLFNEVY